MMAHPIRSLSVIAILATVLNASLALADGSSPAAEDAFLDVLPRIDVPETVEPLPGAVNEEFRHCQAYWPPEYEKAQSGPEARALRDIYGFVRARNVFATRDCSCAGKVATWQEVDRIATALRSRDGVDRLGWMQTADLARTADSLTAVVEKMCGGSF